MGRTACTEPQCLNKGALYLYLYCHGYPQYVQQYARTDLWRISLLRNCPTFQFTEPNHQITSCNSKQLTRFIDHCKIAFQPSNVRSYQECRYFHQINYQLATSFSPFLMFPCLLFRYAPQSRPLVPEFAGSNPAEAVGFFGRKNLQHAFLRRGSKAFCRRFAACKRSLHLRGSRML
jgi:hypothetical protein